MRVIYLASMVVPSRYANAVHVMKMCQAMAAGGHEVDLLVPNSVGRERGVTDIFAYFGVERSFRFKRLMFPPVRGQVSAVAAATLFYIHRHRPDLLYTRSLDFCLPMARFLRVPFVLELHAPVAAKLKPRFLRLAGHPMLRRVVVISQKLRDMLVEDFPALADRIMVAHDGADDPDPSSHAPHAESGFHVGYVGHLYPGRGTDMMRNLAKALPEITFHIVGGTDRDRERFVAAGLTDNVVVHGYRKPSELAGYFPRFDVCLAPYERKVTLVGGAGDTSGFMSPLKIFEYMSWGKAMVVSDLPVLREVLEDGRNAVLVPPDDTDAWIGALKRLMVDPEERRQIGDRARAEFLACYTWKQRAEHVLEGMGP